MYFILYIFNHTKKSIKNFTDSMKNEIIKQSGENPLNTSFIVSQRYQNSNLFIRSNSSNSSGISASSRPSSVSSHSTKATALKRPVIRQSLATSIK